MTDTLNSAQEIEREHEDLRNKYEAMKRDRATLQEENERLKKELDIWKLAINQGNCGSCGHPLKRHGIGRYSKEPMCFDCLGVGEVMCSAVQTHAALAQPAPAQPVKEGNV